MKSLIIAFLLILKHTNGLECDLNQNAERFDCFPESGANETACLQRSCCWNKPIFESLSQPVNIPFCFYPRNFPEYELIENATDPSQSTFTIQKKESTFRIDEILKLEVRIEYDSNQRLHVQIVDPNSERYEVPLINLNRKVNVKAQDTDYLIYLNKSPFALKVYRKSTGRLIFDTSVAPLIYADQYIQFSTMLVNKYFYGIGEHRDFLAHDTNWNSFTMWNRDYPPSNDVNLYGTHPFYMAIESDGNAMGFFFLNSNGMDINVQPNPAMTFITTGGIIDFYIYLGPTPADVIKQHTEIVGRTFFPSYFTLGFHLCRWKYNNSSKLAEVIRRNRAAEIPVEVQWTDIDSMNIRMDWTYDQDNFKELPQIVDDLHKHGQYYINIIDPAISNTPGYHPYESGLESNVFIIDSNTSQPIIGVVWPGTTVFPDFTNPNTTKWWTDMASQFHDIIPFDGIWIDMNEPSSFIDGSPTGCTNNSLDFPPYTPTKGVTGGFLFSKTLCPSSKQYLSSHYNLHNMYGHFEAIATYNALKTIKPNKRPFVLTRSSFGGTGQFSAHWSGDNRANWVDLYYSIPNMLNFNMYGISMVGSDICGFSGDTNEELCIRWMQLGSFYPFMRNHNDDTSKDQDPAVFSERAQEIIKSTLKTRYKLLPYYYTLLYQSHVNGETVARPLFFEFVQDRNTHKIDRQFMIGPALLISPVLYPGATTVSAYFPNETWYNYYNGEVVDNSLSPYVQLDAPIDVINVHLRAGFILPFQYPAMTTKASRLNPFGLVVALRQVSNSNNAYAEGSLYWDDGESLDSIENSNYKLFNFTASQDSSKMGSIQINCYESGYNTSIVFSEVKIYGVLSQPSDIKINDQYYYNYAYNEYSKVLEIKYFYIDLNLQSIVNISWWF